MSHNILILNGPNLNMLGKREPEIYGSDTLESIEKQCLSMAKAIDVSVEFLQSNYEGEIVSLIQDALGKYDGIIINAAAYTHTSVAILDALKAVGLPTIEVHLSNIYQREDYRHVSMISEVAKGVLCGFGPMGYSLALTAMKQILDTK